MRRVSCIGLHAGRVGGGQRNAGDTCCGHDLGESCTRVDPVINDMHTWQGRTQAGCAGRPAAYQFIGGTRSCISMQYRVRVCAKEVEYMRMLLGNTF